MTRRPALLPFARARENSNTLVAVPTLWQSTLFVPKIRAFLGRWRAKWRPVPGLEGSAALSDGAQLISLPGRADSVRGCSAHLLFLDEAARPPRTLIEAAIDHDIQSLFGGKSLW